MRTLGLWLLALVAFPALAQNAIIVSALRDPVDKSYREMARGMALFEKLHALAPRASLRFRLLPRRPDTEMQGISVHVVGDSFERGIRVAADRSFALTVDARALRENASVRPNRRAGTLTWRADIRTPGLPADTRRLGDLRLECRVGMEAGLVSHYPSLFDRVMDRLVGAGFCDQKEPPYLFFADRPLFAVTLVDGARRRTLSAGELYAGIASGRMATANLSHCDCAALLDRAYFVPLGDRSWSDDTRIELEYMDAPSAEGGYAGLAGSTKAEVRNVFGRPNALRFDAGYELWLYQYGPAQRPLEQTEVVVLFDPSGEVAKARLRPAP